MAEDIKIPGMGEVPKKYVIGGVIVGAGIGVIVYIRSRSAAKTAAATATTASASGGMVTDPAGNTCSALDPGSGYCPGTPEDQSYYSNQYAGLGSADYSGYGADSYGGASYGIGTDAAGYPIGSQADMAWQSQQNTGITTNNEWVQEAVGGAISGDPGTIQAALGGVLGGLTVTTAQKNLFLEAVGILGQPPQGYPQPIHTSDTAGTSTGNTGGSTSTGSTGGSSSSGSSGSSGQSTVRVPNVAGMTDGQAQSVLISVGLKPVITFTPAADKKGIFHIITKTNPAAGATVAPGSSVVMYYRVSSTALCQHSG